MITLDWSRFWTRVKVAGPDECWLWQLKPGSHGYGQFCAGGRILLAHRVAWEARRGPVPEGFCVLHSCDVRMCCNGAHLFLGTQFDNNLDMTAKGRRVRGQEMSLAVKAGIARMIVPQRRPSGETHGAAIRAAFRLHPEAIPSGSRNGRAKLTEKHVEEIRRLYREGHRQRDLALAYGVHQSRVSEAISGRTWAVPAATEQSPL
jgi:hypothetical protein